MKKILIVEDDPAIAKALVMFLHESRDSPFRHLAKPFENGSYEIATASTLAECLKFLKKVDVEAVVLDLYLPDSSGVVTLESVAGATRSPVVVLTGDPDRREECLNKGAAAYAVKGDVDRQEFASIVRRAITTRGAREGIREARETLAAIRELEAPRARAN